MVIPEQGIENGLPAEIAGNRIPPAPTLAFGVLCRLGALVRPNVQ
jgi:hypothetical protein